MLNRRRPRSAERMSQPMRTARRRIPAGFTLIEVLIVIAIIVALAGLVAINLLGGKKKAMVGIAQTDMGTLANALRHFHLTYERWPTDEEGLKVLWDKTALADQDGDGAKWTKLLEKPVDADPWGSPWGYRQKSEHGDEETYDLWSIGPDKQEGTEDDIKNWKDDAATGGASGGSSPKSGN